MCVQLRKEEIEYAPVMEPVVELTVVRSKKMSPRRRARLALAVVSASALAGVLLGAVSMIAYPAGRQTVNLPLLSVQTDVNSPVVEFANVTRSAGFVTVAGNVRNAGKTNATEVVVELLDVDHHTLRMDRAMLSPRSSSNGNAPFQALIQDDGRAAGYRLYFQPMAMGKAVTSPLASRQTL